MTDHRCRVSEEDARDSHFDGLTDAAERELALQAHIDRRETLKAYSSRRAGKDRQAVELCRVVARP